MRYAWIITKDHTTADGGAKGVVGPRNATLYGVELALSGKGRRFTLHDDDGECLLEGRIWTGREQLAEIDFAPLDDFGAPSYGCTEIRYGGKPL